MKKLSLILSCVLCIPAVPVLAAEITCPAILQKTDITCSGPDDGFYTPQIKVGSELWQNSIATDFYSDKQDCETQFSKAISYIPHQGKPNV